MQRSRITVVGLGPGGWPQVTLEAREVLAAASEIWLRTSRHPVVPSLPPGVAVHSFDYLYEQEPDFDAVYAAIVDRLLELARRPEGVVYGVPGHPLIAERSVSRLLEVAKSAEVEVRVVAGLSFLEPVTAVLGVDPFAQGMQLLDAGDLAALTSRNHGEPAPRPGLIPTLPLLIAQLYSGRVASAVKLHLLNLYPPEHEVALVKAAGVDGQQAVRRCPLHMIDHGADVDHLTTLYVPPLSPIDNLAEFSGLRYVVARLRGPGGCPWDREQTHESLKPYLIEEAYEVLDALDEGDQAELVEELGDLMLQVVLHAQLSEEAGEFAIEDVLRSITAKLIRRHPHVFGDVAVRDSSEVLVNWQQIKRAEKTNGEETPSLLGNIPRHLPALAYALSLQKRAARTGFDWSDLAGVAQKVAEEVRELQTAADDVARRHELGDLLFSLVNLARWLKVDPEEALREANRRFRTRFLRMEQLARERGLDFAQLSSSEQNDLWEEVKRLEGAGPQETGTGEGPND